MLAQGALTIAIGVGAGLLGSAALTRFLATMLFEIASTDPIISCALATLLAGAAVLAPDLRATRVDPHMSETFLSESIAILTRTPKVLNDQLRNLPELRVHSKDDPETLESVRLRRRPHPRQKDRLDAAREHHSQARTHRRVHALLSLRTAPRQPGEGDRLICWVNLRVFARATSGIGDACD